MKGSTLDSNQIDSTWWPFIRRCCLHGRIISGFYSHPVVLVPGHDSGAHPRRNRMAVVVSGIALPDFRRPFRYQNLERHPEACTQMGRSRYFTERVIPGGHANIRVIDRRTRSISNQERSGIAAEEVAARHLLWNSYRTIAALSKPKAEGGGTAIFTFVGSRCSCCA